MAGLKWAPEARPGGDLIMAMAVRPIAVPMQARANQGFWMGVLAGLKSSTVKKQAESMKAPSSAASAR